jgi:hypothetical protein
MEAALDVALPDEAGHRVKAIQLVTDAIGEVRAGIGAGRQQEWGPGRLGWPPCASLAGFNDKIPEPDLNRLLGLRSGRPA